MAITILNRTVIPATIFQPWDTWKFYVSASDASDVLFNHTTLEITTSLGVKKPSLTSAPWSEIYPSSTVDPYNLMWKVVDNGGDSWSIDFIVPYNYTVYGPAFTDINDWTVFDVASSASSVDVSLDQTPQALTPAYNPVTFRFSSTLYENPGFKYRFEVFKDTIGATGSVISTESVSKYKVAPLIDGTGYIDISKTLSNQVSYHFDPDITVSGSTPDCLVQYRVGVGVEFQQSWGYNLYKNTGGTGAYAANVTIEQDPQVTPHTYVVGDQITIDTPPALLRGLHKVMAVPDQYSVVIDSLYSGSDQPIPGTTNYADGRNTGYPGLTGWTGQAFNGAVSWSKFPAYRGKIYTINQAGAAGCLLLTSLQPYSDISTYPDKRIYVREDETFYLNFAVDQPTDTHTLYYEYGGATGTSVPVVSGATGYLKTIAIGFDKLSITPTIADEPIKFYITGDGGDQLSKEYRIYPDTRCPINEYTLYFMDRFGSILSFPMSLRSKVTGTIERKMYKKALEYNQNFTNYNNVYDLSDEQTKISSVSVDKEYELNTDWMNDGRSLLFEELLTSPHVWLRMKEEPISGGSDIYNYYACTVTETSFDVERQKNKRLIRKTVKVKLSSQNIINI